MIGVLYYFIAIGIIDAVVFTLDKYAAEQGKRRVPEAILHLLELFGGVFFIIPLMYILRHKCRKFSYYIVTYLIFLFWLGAIYFVFLRS
jgi:uncharacterized membrane protein YsdA (DUF1294 family)